MWLYFSLLAACSTVGEPVPLIAPDASRTGADGLHGAFGAAVVSLAAPARVTEVVPVDVVYPTEGDVRSGDDLSPAVQDAPTVVLIHGGLVPPERYWWLGAHFATRGYVTVLPRAELDLAIIQPGNGAVALEALRREARDGSRLSGLVGATGPTALAGHSLGGVLAARQWVRDDEVDLLVMLASFPAAGDPVEDQAGRPVLTVSGTTDQSLEPERFLEQSERFPDGTAVWLASGLNHYGWTDDATDRELAADGALEGALDTLRRRVLALIDAHLDVALRGDDDARLDGPFDGLERGP